MINKKHLTQAMFNDVVEHRLTYMSEEGQWELNNTMAKLPSGLSLEEAVNKLASDGVWPFCSTNNEYGHYDNDLHLKDGVWTTDMDIMHHGDCYYGSRESIWHSVADEIDLSDDDTLALLMREHSEEYRVVQSEADTERLALAAA